MKHIGNLTYAEGSKHKKKRIGRGPGSGYGGTSTKGQNGQQSRRGFSLKRGFEGGQMPLNRRLPKFGFWSRFRVAYQVVNVSRLAELVAEDRIKDAVAYDDFYTLGLISKRSKPVKILGDGELKVALTIEADKFTKSAIEKIEAAGGTVKVHE